MPIDAAKADPLGVFISYSRRDALDFADQLAKSLEMLGYRTIVDREGISGGELWQVRLGQMLLECDTVVFVMSPESATSPICAWEVEEASRLAKRILPVIAMPLGAASPPKHLQQLNFIHFYPEKSVPGSGFGDGLVKLNVALKSDLDWLREHTRLLERATQWEKGNRTTNRMLSGSDIDAAKAWAALRPRDAPEPTALQLDYIKASEAYGAAQQSQRQRQLEERERLVRQAEEERAAREAAQIQATESARREAEQARRVARRTAAGLITALTLAVAASAAGLFAWTQQKEAKAALEKVAIERDRGDEELRKAQIAQSRFLAGKVDEAIKLHDYETTILLALEGLPDIEVENVRPLVQRLPDALYEALKSLGSSIAVNGQPDRLNEEIFVQQLVDAAKGATQRCLSNAERDKYFLDPEAPDWCYSMEKPPYKRRRFGISGREPNEKLAKRLGYMQKTGMIVTRVHLGLPAIDAGIKINDIIVSVNNQPVSSRESLRETLTSTASTPSGIPATFKIWRSGEVKEIKITPQY